MQLATHCRELPALHCAARSLLVVTIWGIGALTSYDGGALQISIEM